MSYQNLANQLRPKFFKDFIANEHIVLILKNMLLSNNIPNGIIFSGVRGVGKTTLSRLLARAINCYSPNGHEPCGVCESCTAENHPDIVELSGATHGKVDDVRKLIDQTSYSPMLSRKKVFIIDEAQGLGISQSSWDTLLKVLEEPPEHILWIFCTTQKGKIPETIKSRLVSLDLRLIPTNDITNYIANILPTNGDLIVPGIIARNANNSLRDALTLCEKIIPYCNDHGWSAEAVNSVLGTFSNDQISNILQCIISHDSACLWKLLESLIANGVDHNIIFEDGLVKPLSDLVTITLGGFVDNSSLYEEPFKQLGVPRIMYLSNILLNRTQQFINTTNKKLVLQILAMELCA